MSIPTPFNPLGTLGGELREWHYTPLTSNTSNPELTPLPELTTNSSNVDLTKMWMAFAGPLPDGDIGLQIGTNGDGIVFTTDKGEKKCSVLAVRFDRVRRFRQVIFGSSDWQTRAIFKYDGGVYTRCSDWLYRNNREFPCNFRGEVLAFVCYHTGGNTVVRPDYKNIRFFE